MIITGHRVIVLVYSRERNLLLSTYIQSALNTIKNIQIERNVLSFLNSL